MKSSVQTKVALTPAFCPGYYREPFLSLCSQVSDQRVYLPKDFYGEWGLVFHLGRLEGTARVWATRPSGDRLAKRARITLSPPGCNYRQWSKDGLGK